MHEWYACQRKQYNIFAHLGNIEIINRLLSNDADAYTSTLQCSAEGYGYRRRGAISAFALAAAHGYRRIMHNMLGTGMVLFAILDCYKANFFNIAASNFRPEEPVTVMDFFRAESGSDIRTDTHSSQRSAALSTYGQMQRHQQRALDDALYYAVEHGHLEIAIELRNIGMFLS